MNPEAYLEMAQTEARHWWFAGRRTIATRLIASLKMKPDAKILEVGSGTGGNLEMLSAFGDVSAMEMDEKARKIAAEKTGGRFDILPGVCPDEIPFEAGTFDLVCLFDVLEHIDDDVATLSKLKVLLADGGRVLATVPANGWLWSAHDEFLHHKRRYSAAELRRKAVEAGFEIDKLSYFNTLLFPLAALARLGDRALGKKSASGTGIPPAPLNDLFRTILGVEGYLLGNFNLPFGVSLLCVLRPVSDK